VKVNCVASRRPNWSPHLAEIEEGYNYIPHSATGFAPMELEDEDATQAFIEMPGMIMPPTQRIPLEERKRCVFNQSHNHITFSSPSFFALKRKSTSIWRMARHNLRYAEQKQQKRALSKVLLLRYVFSRSQTPHKKTKKQQKNQVTEAPRSTTKNTNAKKAKRWTHSTILPLSLFLLNTLHMNLGVL